MKKILVVLCVCVLLFSLCACTQKSTLQDLPTTEQNNTSTSDSDTRIIPESSYGSWKEYKSYSSNEDGVQDWYSFKIPYYQVNSNDAVRAKLFYDKDTFCLFIPQEASFESEDMNEVIGGESSYVAKMIGVFFTEQLGEFKLEIKGNKSFEIAEKPMNKYLGLITGNKDGASVYYNTTIYYQKTNNDLYAFFVMLEPTDSPENEMTQSTSEKIRKIAYSYIEQ